MFKIIERVLRKHLHEAAVEYEREVEMTIVSSMELLWGHLTTEEWRELVQELTVAIRGTDLSMMRQIPSLEDAKKFLRGIALTGAGIHTERYFEEYVDFHAPLLIGWLEGYPKAGLC